MDSNRAGINIWTARVIPVILTGIAGYTTYVLVFLLCVSYLIVRHDNKAAAIPILVIYFFLFILMAASFLRLVQTTIINPPYVPLGAGARASHSNQGKSEKDDGVGAGEYDIGKETEGQNDPDSVGLEYFYTRDIFVADVNGKPRWCGECSNWKPDRAHHCSSAGRCIRKMDHFCPWVGGPIGENNFKFFIQFTSYSALYCTHLLVVMVTYVFQQKKTKGEDVDVQFAVIIGLASLFLLFTGGMSINGLKLAMRNLTQVESLGLKTRVQHLAILRPAPGDLMRLNPNAAALAEYPVITYPLLTGGGASEWHAAHTPPTALIPIHLAYHHGLPGHDFPTSQVHQYLHESAPEIGNLSTLIPEASPLNRLQTTHREDSSETTLNTVELNPYKATDMKEMHASYANLPAAQAESISERDKSAIRTFAVLKTNPGQNPWDLGSHLLNWKTVMGETIIDWLLPLRRSPCCNHEHTESQFSIGPEVDLLRSSVGFLSPENVRNSRDKGNLVRLSKNSSERKPAAQSNSTPMEVLNEV